MLRLAALGVLAAAAAHAAPSAWMQARTAGFHRYDGRFDSADYGFSVAPPPGVAQYVTDGGDANHGPIMILGEHRDVVVYPEYTDPERDTTRPCHNTRFPWERTGTRVAGTARLGGRPACMVTWTHGATVWRVMQATGSGKGAGIMHTLLLTTTRRAARADFAAFQRVADSYRHVPIVP